MKDIKSAILLFLAFTIICGGIYPALVTGVAQAVFPQQAGGSFITDGSGNAIGSTLIGQPFSDPKYFWPRPSATSDFSYNPPRLGRLQCRADQSRIPADHRGAGQDPARQRYRRSAAGGTGPGLGQRPRSAYLPGRRLVADSPGRHGTRTCAKRPSSGRHLGQRRASTRHSRGAAGECPCLESGIG